MDFRDAIPPRKVFAECALACYAVKYAPFPHMMPSEIVLAATVEHHAFRCIVASKAGIEYMLTVTKTTIVRYI